MTLPVEPSFRRWATDGVSTRFQAPRFFTDEQLVVTEIEADGTTTQLTRGVDWYGLGGGTATPEITTTQPRPDGRELFIDRQTPLEQESAYSTWGKFPATRVEADYDRLWMRQQEVEKRLDQVVRVSPLETGGTLTLPSVVERRGQALHFDAVTGDPVAVTPPALVEVVGEAFFEDEAALALAQVDPAAGFVHTVGAAAPDDGGGTARVRHVGPSSLPGTRQSGDGAYWVPTAAPKLLRAIADPDTFEALIPTMFPDLQTAIDWLQATVTNRRWIELVIEDGHALTAGLLVTNGDFGRFRIKSQAATVLLDPGFVGIDDSGFPLEDLDPAIDHLICGHNARMPTLACVIDMAKAHGSGYYGLGNCAGHVEPGCGVLNAGRHGFEWRGGHATITSSVWDGANNAGIRAAYAANVAAQSASADNCCAAPLSTEVGAVEVSRCARLHFRLGSATNSGGCGVNVRRAGSFVGESGDFSGAVNDGLKIQHASHCSVYSVVADNCGRYGIYSDGALVFAEGAYARNSGSFDLCVVGGGDIVGDDITTTNGTPALGDTNLTNFNVTDSSKGRITKVGAPWWRIGEFSTSGATSGKDFGLNHGVLLSSRDSTAEASHLIFYNPNGTVGSIKTDGAGTSYLTSSDRRRKVVSGLMDGALHMLDRVPVQRARFHDEPQANERPMLIADELQQVLPTAVDGEPNGVEPVGRAYDDAGREMARDIREDEAPAGTVWHHTHDRPVYQQVDFAQLIPLLVAAVQELARRLEPGG